MWSPSPSLGASATTFQFVFADAGYQSPYEAHRCDYGAHDNTCNGNFGAQDVKAVIDDIDSYRAGNVRPNADGSVDILLNFGDDFTAENANGGDNGGNYMEYLDSLIDALNHDPSGRFNAFYSTPNEYMASRLKQVASFPEVVSDNFPYNDDTQGHNMWQVSSHPGSTSPL